MDSPELPKETEIEKENGVNDVKTFGETEVNNADNGLNTRGMMQKMRRGTDSHKTEYSDERVDLCRSIRIKKQKSRAAAEPTSPELRVASPILPRPSISHERWLQKGFDTSLPRR